MLTRIFILFKIDFCLVQRFENECVQINSNELNSLNSPLSPTITPFKYRFVSS